MKKIYAVIIFLLCSLFSFANFNDNLNLLKEEDRKIVEEKIKEIANKKGISIFVNTLSIEEGFAISDPEHAVIFNLKKADDLKKFEVEVSFSKDIDMDDHKDEVNEILSSTEEVLKQGEYVKYIIGTLDGIGAMLDDIEIEDLNQMTMTKEQEESGNNNFIVISIAIFIAVAVGFTLYRLEMFDTKVKKKTKNKK